MGLPIDNADPQFVQNWTPDWFTNPHFGHIEDAASRNPPVPRIATPREILSLPARKKGFFRPDRVGTAMAAPGGVDRWLSFELGRLNAGLVTAKKSLAVLLAEPRPACATREGVEHSFEREALDRLAGVLGPEERDALRLPITLFVRGDLEDTAFVSDPLGARALREAERFGSAFPYRDGKMYLPHSLAVDLARRSGGTLQIAFG